MILQKNNHYRISATPTFVWYVIDNYYNNEIQWILRVCRNTYSRPNHGLLRALRTGLIEPTFFLTCTVVYCMVLYIIHTTRIAKQHVYFLLCVMINTQYAVCIYFRKDPTKRNPDIFSLLLL